MYIPIPSPIILLLVGGFLIALSVIAGEWK